MPGDAHPEARIFVVARPQYRRVGTGDADGTRARDRKPSEAAGPI